MTVLISTNIRGGEKYVQGYKSHPLNFPVPPSYSVFLPYFKIKP